MAPRPTADSDDEKFRAQVIRAFSNAPSRKSSPGGNFGLLLIAIIGGVAVAGIIVVTLAMHREHRDAGETPSASRAVNTGRPSPFGAIIKPPKGPTSAESANIDGVKLAADAEAAIVSVTGLDKDGEEVSHGIGYISASNGVIVTSFLAIKNAKSAVIETKAGVKMQATYIIGYRTDQDLALLSVGERDLPALATDETPLKDGDPVVAIGMSRIFYAGAAGEHRASGGADMFQIAREKPGDPLAGPVLNGAGKVVGLVTETHSDGMYAIPVSYIKRILLDNRMMSFDEMLAQTF